MLKKSADSVQEMNRRVLKKEAIVPAYVNGFRFETLKCRVAIEQFGERFDCDGVG